MTPIFGKQGRSPRCRPPLTIARLTHATAPETATATTSGVRIRTGGLDRLLVLHGRERRNAVPVEGRLFEGPGFGSLPHALFIVLDDVARAPLQKGGGPLDVLRVLLLRHGPHAGRRTAADLPEQAGALPVGKDRVLAGSEAEDLLHDLDRLAHGRPVGIGPEEARLAVDPAAIVGESGKGLGTEPQIGIALVVPKEDVVLRAERLDEVVFQKKRLSLAPGDGGFKARDLAHHDRDARGEAGRIAEVGGDALLEVARLPDVEACARRVEVAVASGQVRKRPDLPLRLELGLRPGVLVEDDAVGLRLLSRSWVIWMLTSEDSSAGPR